MLTAGQVHRDEGMAGGVYLPHGTVYGVVGENRGGGQLVVAFLQGQYGVGQTLLYFLRHVLDALLQRIEIALQPNLQELPDLSRIENGE